MAQLIVRRLEDKVVRKLKERAAKYGVSMEEEHRRILRNTLYPPKQKPKLNFKEFLLTVPDFGDPDSLRQKDLPREINFD
jgi:plasmid stability protein